MFGQHNTSHEDTSVSGAPALPADTANTGTGAPEDTTVKPQFGDASGGLSNMFMPAAPPAAFSGAVMNTPAPSFGTTYAAPAAPAATPMSAPASTDDLVRMKQEALQHLQPLVSNLQQSPEEEFRTLMMMIQATDDKSMLQKALEAAKRIGDDKMRAQAMLDVINEINYFTQSSQE